MRRKKINNKGFSLVELIIVIAIMAILAAALAPQLMKYIEKSRVSADTHNCAAIESAINAALAEEAVYKDVTNCGVNLVGFDIRVGTGGALSFIAVAGGLSDVPQSLQDELKVSLNSLKAPKANGKNQYCCRIQVDTTKRQVKNVVVETIP